MLDRLFIWELINYLTINRLPSDQQSAYQAFRSTETAIAGLLLNILLALNAGNIAGQALLRLFCTAAVDIMGPHHPAATAASIIWSAARHVDVASADSVLQPWCLPR